MSISAPRAAHSSRLRARRLLRTLCALFAASALVACTQGGSPRVAERRPEPGGHSAVACRACGSFVDGQTALTFQGQRDHGSHGWLESGAWHCIARAKRDGWSLDGDLQVEVVVDAEGKGKHACGAHKGMDPRLAACLLDAFDADAPAEAKGRTFATWVVPAELARDVPAEPPNEPLEYDRCLGVSASVVPPPQKPERNPRVRDCRIPDRDAVIASVREKVRGCYQSGLNVDPAMEGRVGLAVSVASDGEVERACTANKGSMSLPVVHCIARSVKALRFKPPVGGPAVMWVDFRFVNEMNGVRTPPPPRQRTSPWPWPVWVR